LLTSFPHYFFHLYVICTSGGHISLTTITTRFPELHRNSLDPTSSDTKREGPRQQPDPFKLYLIACDWSSIQHTRTPTEHSQQLAPTQTPLSLLQTQTLHRASKIEFHNSELHKKSPPTQASNLPEH
jgi:hypothetical protein